MEADDLMWRKQLKAKKLSANGDVLRWPPANCNAP